MEIELRGGAQGIVAFGSARISVVPDRVVVELAVVHVRATPTEAFEACRVGAAAVTTALAAAGVASADVQMANATLRQAFKGFGPDAQFLGYEASIAFRVVVGDARRLEVVLADTVAAGANRLASVKPATTQLTALRADARRQAVAAARAKAELYASAAGVALGPVLHIQDENPDGLAMRGGHGGMPEARESDTDLRGATPPGSIEVAAAVTITYAIAR